MRNVRQLITLLPLLLIPFSASEMTLYKDVYSDSGLLVPKDGESPVETLYGPRIGSYEADIKCNDIARMINDIEAPIQKDYIIRFKDIAISEMHRTGIPASIKLAKGILESRSGTSQLAIKSNNHYSIKQHKWRGPTVKFKDDHYEGGILVHSSFRVYSSPEESFKDHSAFLMRNKRYKSLFDLPCSDYKGWSHGLKKAKYATDPKYAYKLIQIIEDLKLYKLDDTKNHY